MSRVPQVPDYDPLSAAPHPEEGLRRGRYGRPKLIPKGLTTRVEYTRASSLSDYIMGGNTHGLDRWMKRLIIRGAGIRPDLARMAAAESYDQAPGTEKDVLYREAGQNLDSYWEQAIEAAGGHDKANWGTAVHSLMRPGSKGIIAEEDVELRRSVEGVKAAMRGIDIIGSELFVANDELLVAGTFDAAVDIQGLPPWPADCPVDDGLGECSYSPGKCCQSDIEPLVCADWKTGELHIIEHIVQLAGYCRGELYDVNTDKRTTFAEHFGRPMRTDVGLVVRIPPNLANHPVPEKRAKLYLVDLDEGWRLAKIAAYIRQMQKTQSLGVVQTLDPRELAQARIRRQMIDLGPSITTAALSELYHRWSTDWCDELTVFGRGLLEATA